MTSTTVGQDSSIHQKAKVVHSAENVQSSSSALVTKIKKCLNLGFSFRFEHIYEPELQARAEYQAEGMTTLTTVAAAQQCTRPYTMLHRWRPLNREHEWG
jgi:hypothetical protein